MSVPLVWNKMAGANGYVYTAEHGGWQYRIQREGLSSFALYRRRAAVDDFGAWSMCGMYCDANEALAGATYMRDELEASA